MAMKGQVFVMSSVIFSSILLLSFVSTGPVFTGNPTPDTQEYFAQSLEETTAAFNSALQDNFTIEKAERRVYSYDRFLERRSKPKGIDYRAYHVLVVPESGNATFVNYFNRSVGIELRVDGSWKNTTVYPLNSTEKNFSPGRVNVHLEVDSFNNTHDFDAASPRILTYGEMESEDETWKNSYIG